MYWPGTWAEVIVIVELQSWLTTRSVACFSWFLEKYRKNKGLIRDFFKAHAPVGVLPSKFFLSIKTLFQKNCDGTPPTYSSSLVQNTEQEQVNAEYKARKARIHIWIRSMTVPWPAFCIIGKLCCSTPVLSCWHTFKLWDIFKLWDFFLFPLKYKGLQLGSWWCQAISLGCVGAVLTRCTGYCDWATTKIFEMAEFGGKSSLYEQLFHSRIYQLKLNIRTQFPESQCEVFVSELLSALGSNV